MPTFIRWLLPNTAVTTGATLSTCQSSNGNGVNSACTFYDIAAGDNDVVCSGRTNCYTPTRDRYGVLSTSSTTSSVAYSANKGWDFATGLGTVNVTNLVNNWRVTVERRPRFDGGYLSGRLIQTYSACFGRDLPSIAAHPHLGEFDSEQKDQGGVIGP